MINDGVTGCEFDVVAKFIEGSVSVTDEDSDGLTPRMVVGDNHLVASFVAMYYAEGMNLLFGPGRQEQTILTGTYRLNASRTIGTP